MALVPETTGNFASFRGTPSSNTVYQRLDFGFKAIAVKIVVPVGGTLDVSMNGTDTTPHMVLGAGQHDFPILEIGRLFVRNTAAGISQVFAWVN